MPTKEIEESDLLNLQHITGVVDKVMANPQTRQGFLQLAKTAIPTLPIPEVDAAKPIIEAVHAQNKKIDEWMAAQAKKEQEAEESRRVSDIRLQWQNQEDELRREGWRPAGLEAVRKFAEENGILSLRIAADAYERRNPQPGPIDSRQGWDLFGGGNRREEDTFVKDMMESQASNEARLDKEIYDTLAEVRSAY